MRVIAIILALLAVTAVSGCKDFPGADGRYAVRGDNEHGSP
jgi:hypothetical protein